MVQNFELKFNLFVILLYSTLSESVQKYFLGYSANTCGQQFIIKHISNFINVFSLNKFISNSNLKLFKCNFGLSCLVIIFIEHYFFDKFFLQFFFFFNFLVNNLSLSISDNDDCKSDFDLDNFKNNLAMNIKSDLIFFEKYYSLLVQILQSKNED